MNEHSLVITDLRFHELMIAIAINTLTTFYIIDPTVSRTDNLPELVRYAVEFAPLWDNIFLNTTHPQN